MTPAQKLRALYRVPILVQDKPNVERSVLRDTEWRISVVLSGGAVLKINDKISISDDA